MNELNRFINNDPNAIVLMGFFSGLLFSSISWGIIYVILFLILWEILYFGYLDANGKPWDMDYRVTVVMAALLGYLTGAFFHDADDHYNSLTKFRDDCDHYGKECGWFN